MTTNIASVFSPPLLLIVGGLLVVGLAVIGYSPAKKDPGKGTTNQTRSIAGMLLGALALVVIFFLYLGSPKPGWYYSSEGASPHYLLLRGNNAGAVSLPGYRGTVAWKGTLLKIRVVPKGGGSAVQDLPYWDSTITVDGISLTRMERPSPSVDPRDIGDLDM